jgi:prepilin-type N-terminal cleavage/methylation domain-containing protein
MITANRKFKKIIQMPKVIGCEYMVVNYRRRSGFTLIELLVVIAIIALLLSILMPALTKAKNQAMRVICKSQLHQAGLGIVMYASENNSKLSIGNFFNYPIANYGDSDPGDPHHGSKDDGFIGTDIQPYLSSEDLSIFMCPANKTVRRMPAFFAGGDTRGMFTYEWYKSGHFNYDGPSPSGNHSYYVYYYYLGNYAWENSHSGTHTWHLTFEERGLKAKGLIYPANISGPRAKLMQDIAMDDTPLIVYGYGDAHKYPNSLWTDGSADSSRKSDLTRYKRTATSTDFFYHYW